MFIKQNANLGEYFVIPNITETRTQIVVINSCILF